MAAVYCTVAQAQALYSEDYIAVACDRDGDGEVDTDSFEKCLRTASRKMDGYMLGRVPLPLPDPLPDQLEHFQKICCDIAVHDGAPTADVRTEIMKDAYKEAIEYMVLIATGKVKIALVEGSPERNANLTPVVQTHSTVAVVAGSERLFTRDKVRGLL